jgi:hypothetical protein
MSTLETQYKNYMDENPLSEFTFEEWKRWHGFTLAQSLYNFNKSVDKQHLEWIYNRMITVYNEDPNIDYMITFKTIMDKL